MDVLLCFGLFNKICLYNLTQPFLATLSRPVQQGDLYANVSMEVKNISPPVRLRTETFW